MENKRVKNFRGYCTPNRFGEYKIPIPAQNIIYRDYCKKHNFNFSLSRNELFFKESYIIQNEILKELDQIDGILMCSFFMLPKNEIKAEKFLNNLIELKSEIHFVLESVIIKNHKDVENLKEIIKLKKISAHCLDLQIITNCSKLI